ncbi:hydrogenase 4 membrane component (E), partial [mine drainage metagenome]
MSTFHPNGLAAAVFNLLSILALILSFVMLASHWIRNHILAFAIQSWVIACLSAFIGLSGHDPELIPIAILTALLRGTALPYLLIRLLDQAHLNREFAPLVQPSSSMVLGAALVLLAYTMTLHLGPGTHIPDPTALMALTTMLAITLIGFLMLVLRTEALSHLLALLVIENGIFLGSQILMPGMPVLLELVILFDLIIIVVTFGILVRFLKTEIGSTDSR